MKIMADRLIEELIRAAACATIDLQEDAAAVRRPDVQTPPHEGGVLRFGGWLRAMATWRISCG
jgi:hypothetical protein